MTARSCPGCEQSLEQACCGITPQRLCGLCQLLPAETLQAYADRWKVRDTVPLVEQVVMAKRRQA
jgi:hypothetical protein